VLVLGVSLASFACGSHVPRAGAEDVARSMVPVPICLERLPRAGDGGNLVALEEAEYWTLLLPGLTGADSDRSGLVDCSGRRLPEQLWVDAAKPRLARVAPAIVSPAADGMKVVWLPSHQRTAKRVAGVLALTRAVDAYFEVYALGAHEGLATGTRFGVERMGPDLVLTATEESCLAPKPGPDDAPRCRATTIVHSIRSGRLRLLGGFPVQDFGTTSDLGGSDLELRFSASVDFADDAVLLNERLSVLDPVHGEVRSSELSRRLVVLDDALVASAPSLWETGRTSTEPD
jgi:hypothetical protein